MPTLDAFDPEAVLRATSLLDAGELVVVPTAAGYALAADALNEEAVLRLFDAKERAPDRAIPVALSTIEDAHHAAFPTPLARHLAEAPFAARLALVLRARPWLPDALTAGGDTVALRLAGHPALMELARHFGPMAVSSARRPGQPRAVDADAAAATFGARVSLVLDAGRLEAADLTVVDATGPEAKVLRDGTIGAAEIARHGRVEV